MIKIIINADDFGLNAEVNKSIMDAIVARRISSTTILANSPYLKEIAAFSKSNPLCSYGVHLNITEGRSLTNSPVLFKKGFIDESGYFRKDYVLKNRVIVDDELISAIKEEWDLQIKTVRYSGISISHIDGHHHCHTWFGLTESLCELLYKYNIGSVRNRYSYPHIPIKKRLKIIIVYFLKFLKVPLVSIMVNGSPIASPFKEVIQDDCFRKVLNKVTKTDFFMSYEEFVKSKFNIKRKDSIFELMCHPGLKKYRNEEILLNADVISLANSLEMKLISYNNL